MEEEAREGSEEEINILFGLSRMFRRAAEALRKEKEKQEVQSEPKAFVKEKPQAEDWM